MTRNRRAKEGAKERQGQSRARMAGHPPYGEEEGRTEAEGVDGGQSGHPKSGRDRRLSRKRTRSSWPSDQLTCQVQVEKSWVCALD